MSEYLKKSQNIPTSVMFVEDISVQILEKNLRREVKDSRLMTTLSSAAIYIDAEREKL